jgi:hypothetical protein
MDWVLQEGYRYNWYFSPYMKTAQEPIDLSNPDVKALRLDA